MKDPLEELYTIIEETCDELDEINFSHDYHMGESAAHYEDLEYMKVNNISNQEFYLDY